MAGSPTLMGNPSRVTIPTPSLASKIIPGSLIPIQTFEIMVTP